MSDTVKSKFPYAYTKPRIVFVFLLCICILRVEDGVDEGVPMPAQALKPPSSPSSCCAITFPRSSSVSPELQTPRLT